MLDDVHLILTIAVLRQPQQRVAQSKDADVRLEIIPVTLIFQISTYILIRIGRGRREPSQIHQCQMMLRHVIARVGGRASRSRRRRLTAGRRQDAVFVEGDLREHFFLTRQSHLDQPEHLVEHILLAEQLLLGRARFTRRLHLQRIDQRVPRVGDEENTARQQINQLAANVRFEFPPPTSASAPSRACDRPQIDSDTRAARRTRHRRIASPAPATAIHHFQIPAQPRPDARPTRRTSPSDSDTADRRCAASRVPIST